MVLCEGTGLAMGLSDFQQVPPKSPKKRKGFITPEPNSVFGHAREPNVRNVQQKESISLQWGAGIIQWYGLDEPGFASRQGLGIFLFTTASRPALGPTQPPIQWVPGGLSLD
jgi:hypothetical protein